MQLYSRQRLSIFTRQPKDIAKEFLRANFVPITSFLASYPGGHVCVCVCVCLVRDKSVG